MEIKKQSERLYFIDNIRAWIIMLVVAHHAGQAFGPTGGFWFFQHGTGQDAGRILLC